MTNKNKSNQDDKCYVYFTTILKNLNQTKTNYFQQSSQKQWSVLAVDIYFLLSKLNLSLFSTLLKGAIIHPCIWGKKHGVVLNFFFLITPLPSTDHWVLAIKVLLNSLETFSSPPFPPPMPWFKPWLLCACITVTTVKLVSLPAMSPIQPTHPPQLMKFFWNLYLTNCFPA